MTDLAIAANELRKSYGDKTVLDGIDLAVPEGTVFSLLGPNGAGKTTAVKILSTLIGADAGELRVGGHDLTAQAQACVPRSVSRGSSPPSTPHREYAATPTSLPR
jgi:ABC-2 type transport system ATP-binding protein